MTTSRTGLSRTLLGQTLAACRNGVLAVGMYSLCINLLMLTAPLYMLQVFDRVIAGRSADTLLYLTLIALIAFCSLAALEVVRSRTMVKLGTWLDRRLSGPLLTSQHRRRGRQPRRAVGPGLARSRHPAWISDRPVDFPDP
jgi:ABC-type protease/lipase transport system fused ATPase/permease subunit